MARSALPTLSLLLLLSGGFLALAADTGTPVTVAAWDETPPIVSGGDALADIALVASGSKSFVIVTDSLAGIQVHGRDEGEGTYRPDGVMAGVDVVADFSFGGSSTAPLVLASNQTTSAVTLYRLVAEGPSLEVVASVPLAGQPSPGALAAFRGTSGAVFVFVALGAQGVVQQYQLSEQASPTATLVRTLHVGSEVSALGVDPALPALYVTAAGESAVRRYAAAPDGDEAWTEVGSGLSAPLGALDLFRPGSGTGYLLVSESSHARLAVMRLEDGAVMGRVQVGPSSGSSPAGTSVDATQGIRALALGRAPFAEGTLAVGDAFNETGQNVKLVRWADLAQAFTPPLGTGGSPGPSPDGGPSGGGAAPAGGEGSGNFPSSHTADDGCSAAGGALGVSSVLALVAMACGRSLRRRRQS